MSNTREVKFRAWLPDRKCMLYDGTWFETRIGFADSGGDKLLVGGEGVFLKSMYANGNPYKLAAIPMQYTGLKDKNGVEIYEGDVVRNTKSGKVSSIKWHGTMAGFIYHEPKEPGKATHEWGELFRIFDHSEVIGNIYENPELLHE